AIHGDIGKQSLLFERPISSIVIQKLRHGIVCYYEIDTAIAVVIGNGNTEALARLCHANLLGNFSEVDIAIVVIHQRCDGLERIRMAIRSIALSVLSTPDVVK